MSFLLNATIRKHGQSYEKIDEEFPRIVRKKTYVDDLNCGVNDVEEGFDLYKKLKFRLGGSNKNVKVVIIQDTKLMKKVKL